MFDATARHIVLAGDSILDNDVYVEADEPSVIQQLQEALPQPWVATKIAVDGDCMRDVYAQLQHLPQDATDLILSVGGNDMLGFAHLLDRAYTPKDLPDVLRQPASDFTVSYAALLDTLQAMPLRVAICTVYTAIPFEEPDFRQYGAAAISMFNQVMVAEAEKRGIAIIRLEEVCTDPADFSVFSPIEPSAIGGRKIVDAITNYLSNTH